MKNPLRNIFLSNRFFLALSVPAILFALSFAWEPFFLLARISLLACAVLLLAESILLFNPGTRIRCARIPGGVLSLGDENSIQLIMENASRIPLRLLVIDELPFQLRKRDFHIRLMIPGGSERKLKYFVRPVIRGEYVFRNINIYASAGTGLLQRRIIIPAEMHIPAYPSIIQMKEFELKTLSRISFFGGVKKMRHTGLSYEFDQIKRYVRGDDIRSINWKATGRTGELMVNLYQEEKSQQVFCLIDKSRNMKMPFRGLSLLDYSINSALTISNIALHKEDRVGLITFSDRIGTTLAPDRHRGQLRKILEALYNEKERFLEANYELLYLHVRNFIHVRSLLLLFTNFESFYSIQRAVSLLRKLNRLHLLVVIFFENDEISDYGMEEAHSVEEIYYTTIARSFAAEKMLIRRELIKHGIQTIISKPEDLSVNTINKYLELKARGLI